MAWSTSSGISLKYECDGEGLSVIVIHELGGGLHSWHDLVKRLPAGFRTLRYDMRGAGMSEKVRQPFSMDDQVRDLESLIADANLAAPYLIVGCAVGTGIALRFAEKHRESMAGLILCSPALDVSEDRKKYLVDRSKRAADEGMRAVMDDTLARSYPPAVRRDPAVYESYKSYFLANDPVSYGLANGALSDANSDNLGANVTCPCLVLAGEHDLLRPEVEVRVIAQRIPNAQFGLIDAGHLPHVQTPQRLAELIVSFVQQHRLT